MNMFTGEVREVNDVQVKKFLLQAGEYRIYFDREAVETPRYTGWRTIEI